MGRGFGPSPVVQPRTRGLPTPPARATSRRPRRSIVEATYLLRPHPAQKMRRGPGCQAAAPSALAMPGAPTPGRSNIPQNIAGPTASARPSGAVPIGRRIPPAEESPRDTTHHGVRTREHGLDGLALCRLSWAGDPQATHVRAAWSRRWGLGPVDAISLGPPLEAHRLACLPCACRARSPDGFQLCFANTTRSFDWLLLCDGCLWGVVL